MADHVPEKRMADYGAGLILTGFALESVPVFSQVSR